jgi:hypothetical protein
MTTTGIRTVTPRPTSVVRNPRAACPGAAVISPTVIGFVDIVMLL